MSNALKDYQAATVNWRAELQKNTRRTYYVMALFILTYVLIGIVIDILWSETRYPGYPLSSYAHALVTFQIKPWATMIMCAVAVISIWISLWFNNRLMLLGTNYKEILADSKNTLVEKQLYNTVEEMKIAAGLTYMPRVFILEADYMNAFASGYSEKSAMIAITRGLLSKLNRDELQAVIAHELSHIRHLDIKLTLTAVLLANLMIIFIDIALRVFTGSQTYNRRQNSEKKGNGANVLFIVLIVLRVALPLINALVLLYLSRTREFMADAGAVELTRSNQPLATALLKIQGDHQDNQEKYAKLYQETPHENLRQEAYIYMPKETMGFSNFSFNNLFATHPTLEARLRSIGFKK